MDEPLTQTDTKLASCPTGEEKLVGPCFQGVKLPIELVSFFRLVESQW